MESEAVTADGGTTGERSPSQAVVTLARQLVQALEGAANPAGESSSRTSTHTGEEGQCILTGS